MTASGRNSWKTVTASPVFGSVGQRLRGYPGFDPIARLRGITVNCLAVQILDSLHNLRAETGIATALPAFHVFQEKQCRSS
jgi:hypothetical protein